MADKPCRLFLDTSALIAGIVSTSGAAHEVLRLCEAGAVELFLSRQVLTEADRNFSAKLSAFVSDYRELMSRMSPTLVDDPSVSAVAEAAKVIHHHDAPILAAAISEDVDYLISWNTKHFHKQAVMSYVRFKIMTPGEFLEAFRQSLSSS